MNERENYAQLRELAESRSTIARLTRELADQRELVAALQARAGELLLRVQELEGKRGAGS